MWARSRTDMPQACAGVVEDASEEEAGRPLMVDLVKPETMVRMQKMPTVTVGMALAVERVIL